METIIQKWGNSLGIRIPQHVAQELHLYKGSIIEISIEGNYITLLPKRYNLSTMLDQITEENIQDNVLEDSTKGKEEW